MSERVEEIRREVPSWWGWLANLSEYESGHSLTHVTSDDVKTLLTWADDLLAAHDRLKTQMTYPDDPARSVAAMLSRMSPEDKQAFNFCIKQVEGSRVG